MEQFIKSLADGLSHVLAPELVTFLISIFPVLEIRGGLIAARLLDVGWKTAFVICVLGNLLPIPFILIFIKRIFSWLKNTRFVRFIDKLEEKANKKGEKILKYKCLGLFLFVAIPFPGTGAWTGALIAALLNMKLKESFLSILCGVVTAGFIMSIVYMI